jgi:hypothetical protein
MNRGKSPLLLDIAPFRMQWDQLVLVTVTAFGYPGYIMINRRMV